MANTKSAKKAIRVSQRKAITNKYWKNGLRKTKKELKDLMLQNKDRDAVAAKLAKAKKIADKAVSCGSFHKNKSARIKSGLDKKFNKWAKLINDKKPA
ncbi:30S ribosomal protein S20 [Candidatus Parcubacteria bacterium]|nr:30S ribosomal protein S20 [Patescibacteria group bacterium]MBU4381222.1 30S ribosomal protein S20 [Patescibacteria group bacterium]MCG2689254.1 30S ribosomal protein S20 [Candidatus Parcubacteria bacterium]